MSSRKRTKRKNSEDDFDLDDDDDGGETSDINKWSCQSCTFMNRAAAYKCLVCGTRKGTSTRRSRVNDNVVEMQKTITDMVQKQVEKEKSLKRRERSLYKSMTRESDGAAGELVVKEEPVNTFEDVEATTSTVPQEPLPSVVPIVQNTTVEPPREKRKYNKRPKPVVLDEHGQVITPPKKETKKSKMAITEIIDVEKEDIVLDKPTHLAPQEIKQEIQEEMSQIPSCSYKTPTPQPTATSVLSTASQSPVYPDIPVDVPLLPIKLTPPKENTEAPVATPRVPICIPPVPFEGSILQHLPERIVKKLNQPTRTDFTALMERRKLTGIDPIVADAEAILLPSDWDRSKVMRGLLNGTNQYVSPATSRQSSETDSSSEANRSFETPLNDASSSPSKSCQIPDYMIHRDAPRKLFVVANGFPAYFEEFPRRMQ